MINVTYLIGVHRDLCDRVKIENGCCVGVKREGGEEERRKERGREEGKRFSDIYLQASLR